MPGAEWFPGARLNYAEHALRFERPGATALFYFNERTALAAMSWEELGGAVRPLHALFFTSLILENTMPSARSLV